MAATRDHALLNQRDVQHVDTFFLRRTTSEYDRQSGGSTSNGGRVYRKWWAHRHDSLILPQSLRQLGIIGIRAKLILRLLQVFQGILQTRDFYRARFIRVRVKR
jgi:hypothetical protein